MEKYHILLDADTGVDDALALLYALKSPKVKLEGVTTIFGNINEKQAARNSMDLIALANPGYEVPVAIGASETLRGEREEGVPFIHGYNGIGDAHIPESPQKVLAMNGVDFMIQKAKELDGKLIIVATGRLTNVALALQKEPNFAKYVKKLVVMGGTVFAPGNTTPVAEANIHGDPDAADQVFQSDLNVTMVGLDVTMKTLLTYDKILYLERNCREENRSVVDFMKDCLKLYMNFYRQSNNFFEACAMHDPLAMLIAVDPSVVKTQKFKARVECADCMCKGMIVTDRRVRSMEDAKYVEFCLEVDSERAVNELLSVFL